MNLIKLIFKMTYSIPFFIIFTTFSVYGNYQDAEDGKSDEEIVTVNKTDNCEMFAFPGAEGFGRYARGGRGGDVCYVDNLNDSGPGSLRYGIESADGPRIILFRISGIINLDGPLHIEKPFITIASLLSADENNWLMVNEKRGITKLYEPVPAPPMPTIDAIASYEHVLDSSGAFPRDMAVARIVAQIRNSKGHLIDTQAVVNGWPEYFSVAPPMDSDRDGIPDEWEFEDGLDQHDPSDGNADRNGDGYTNLEEYLNWRHQQVMKK